MKRQKDGMVVIAHLLINLSLQASVQCKALGDADLASVPDKIANDFIKSNLRGNIWIGGKKIVSKLIYNT